MKVFNKKVIMIFIAIFTLITAGFVLSVISRNKAIKSGTLALRIDSKFIDLKGEQGPYIDSNDVIFMPLDIVSSNLGAVIKLNKSSKTAIINGKQVKINSQKNVHGKVFVPTKFIEDVFEVKTELSKIYRVVTVYRPNRYMSLKQFELLRQLPSRTEAFDNKAHNFEDSNVWCFTPVAKSSNKAATTIDGRYNNAIDFMKAAIYGVESEYSLNYNNLNQYRQNLIKVYEDKGTRIIKNGKIETTTQFVEDLVNQYANRKVTTQAKFYTHPGLIYYTSDKKIAVRGVMEYKILLGNSGWWFNSKYPHKVGQLYSRDVEVLLYDSLDGQGKKVSEINLLSKPVEIER